MRARKPRPCSLPGFGPFRASHKPNLPEGKLNLPEGKLSLPEGKLSLPEGKLNLPEGKLNLPEGKPNLPRGKLSLPEGKLSLPEGKADLPWGKFSRERPLHRERGLTVGQVSPDHRPGGSLQQFLNKLLRIKGGEILRSLAEADVAGGDAQLLLDGDNDAALAAAVELGDDEAGERDGFVKLARLRQRVRAGGGIDD